MHVHLLVSFESDPGLAERSFLLCQFSIGIMALSDGFATVMILRDGRLHQPQLYLSRSPTSYRTHISASDIKD